jgi:hypothetical protein
MRHEAPVPTPPGVKFLEEKPDMGPSFAEVAVETQNLARSPASLVESTLQPFMERRMLPLNRVSGASMMNWIVVYVVHVAIQIFLVPYDMVPIPILPHPAWPELIPKAPGICDLEPMDNLRD